MQSSLTVYHVQLWDTK